MIAVIVQESVIDPAIDDLIDQARERIQAAEATEASRQEEAEALAQIEYETYLEEWLTEVVHLIPEALRPHIERNSGLTPFRFLCPSFKLAKPGNSNKEVLTIKAPALCPIHITFICQESTGWQIHQMINVSMPDGSTHPVQGLDQAIVLAADHHTPRTIQKEVFC